jgi:alpha-ketoglutarate-dependent taurine dioxygenase
MTSADSPAAFDSAARNPFLPGDEAAYQAWRERKLQEYPTDVSSLLVPIADPGDVSEAEYGAVVSRCAKTNLALYDLGRASVAGKAAVRALGRRFGLVHLDSNLYADEDSITSLQVTAARRQRDYIPYTNRRLNWHTDGYYNASEQRIRGIVMHCVRDAWRGGDNRFLDHEIAYILLRDANPRYITALMQPDAMTIPPNIEAGIEVRPAETGPVFSVEIGTGNLHMRYSARLRNISWKNDPDTQAAVSFLQDLWTNGCPYMYHFRLVPGQGVICNNVLHSRAAFEDSPATGRARLLYRARYFDRVRGTDLSDIFTP